MVRLLNPKRPTQLARNVAGFYKRASGLWVSEGGGAAYKALILSAAPIGYWTFAEDGVAEVGGNAVLSASGVTFGEPAISPDGHGGAKLDGVDTTSITLGTRLPTTTLTAFSIEFIIKPNSDLLQKAFFRQGSTSTTRFFLGQHTDNSLKFLIGGTTRVLPNTIMNQISPSHIVVTRDASDVWRVYVNGVIQEITAGVFTHSQAIALGAEDPVFCSASSTWGTIAGQGSDMTIYDRVLGVAEIEEHAALLAA